MEGTRRLQAETEGLWPLQAETAGAFRLGLKELSFAPICLWMCLPLILHERFPAHFKLWAVGPL